MAVPADASYLTGTSVAVTVSASKSGFTSPDDVTRTLTIDLAAPTAPTYTAPASLTVGVALDPVGPSGGSDIDAYAAAGLPSGLAIDAATGVIGGTPDTASAGTATVTVTVTDAAGNTDTVDIVFPAVAKGTQSLSGFAYSPAAATAGGAAPALSAPTGAVGTLSYATGDTGVCTVDAATGALTLVGAGECVITATAAGTADYEEATAMFTVDVRAANAAATGEPSITGTARVDEVLTAGAGHPRRRRRLDGGVPG